MNNNKNLHNLVQIFSNFAHICIDYVLGSETLLRPHSSAKIQSHQTAWNLVSVVPPYVLSRLFLTIWCYLNLNKESILRKICQCELHMEWKLTPGLVSFTVIHILWAHGLKASVCSTAVILILFNKMCLLFVGFEFHHSTFLT